MRFFTTGNIYYVGAALELLGLAAMLLAGYAMVLNKLSKAKGTPPTQHLCFNLFYKPINKGNLSSICITIFIISELVPKARKAIEANTLNDSLFCFSNLVYFTMYLFLATTYYLIYKFEPFLTNPGSKEEPEIDEISPEESMLAIGIFLFASGFIVLGAS